jgi:hypothetical protein
MAGRQKMRADVMRLDVEPELGEVVLGMMAEGKHMARICDATGLTKNGILAWLDKDPERAELASRARTRAAHSLVDEALQIADEADEENPLAIQKAKLRTQVRQWTAERWNKKDYAAAKAEVNISLAGLHFEALRHRAMPQDTVIDVTPRPTDDELANL